MCIFEHQYCIDSKRIRCLKNMCEKIIYIIIVIIAGIGASPASYYTTSFKQYTPEISKPPIFDVDEKYKNYDFGDAHKPPVYDFSDIIIPEEPWENLFESPKKPPHYYHEEVRIAEPPKKHISLSPPSSSYETIPSYQEIFIKYPKPNTPSFTKFTKKPQKSYIVNKHGEQVLSQGFQNRPSKKNVPFGFDKPKAKPAPKKTISDSYPNWGKPKNRYEVHEHVDDVPPDTKKVPVAVGTNPMQTEKPKKEEEPTTAEPKIKLKLWYDEVDQKK